MRSLQSIGQNLGLIKGDGWSGCSKQEETAWHVTIHLSSDVLPNETLFKTSCAGVKPVEMCPNVMGERRVLFSKNPSMCSHVLLCTRDKVFIFQNHAYLCGWAYPWCFTLTNRPIGPNMQLSTGRSSEFYWSGLKTRISRRGCAYMRDSFSISIFVKDYMSSPKFLNSHSLQKNLFLWWRRFMSWILAAQDCTYGYISSLWLSGD